MTRYDRWNTLRQILNPGLWEYIGTPALAAARCVPIGSTVIHRGMPEKMPTLAERMEFDELSAAFHADPGSFLTEAE